MTQANETQEAPKWTCARCGVTASWTPATKDHRLPSGWSEEDGVAYCLACRRDLAAEAGVDAAPEDSSGKTRERAGKDARIEFEINRDPERTDGEVARAASSSLQAVRKVKERRDGPEEESG
jgi:hypothetical protein